MASGEATDMLPAMMERLPEWVRALPVEQQREYIRQLHDHFHREQTEKEEALCARKHWRRTVAENYKPKNPHVYDFDRWEFSDRFSAFLENLKASKDRHSAEVTVFLEEPLPQVFTFDMLTSSFSEELVEEVQHFEQWCVGSGLHVNRPNSMNRYGAILDDFGFDKALDRLMQEVVSPLATFLYEELGEGLSSHHGFVVEYEPGKDTRLGFHVDDSQVTLNVCLGRDFLGGDLYFGGIRCAGHRQTAPRPSEEYLLKHQRGRAVLHLGQHRHSAKDIISGYRCNLILWCRRASSDNTSCSSHHANCHKQGHAHCPSWCGLNHKK